MDKSDDYFDDDLVFDEQTLAALDHVEQVKSSIAARPAAQKPVEHVAKRQRTDHGWKAGLGNGSRSHGLEDLDDMPEISVTSDGKYNVGAAATPAPPPPPPPPPQEIGQPSRATTAEPPRPLAQPSRGGLRRSDSGRALRLAQIASELQGSQPRAPANNNSTSTITAYHAPINSQNRSRPPVMQRTTSTSSNHGQRSRQSSDRPPSRGGAPSRHASPAIVAVPLPVVQEESTPLNAQMEAMQAQLAELRQQTEQMQRRLKEAEDIRYAKEGEVTMLRQKMTKTAQEHNSSIARLQASKAEAEAKQAQMQREMNEEMERLRTQFHFKQHELTTSRQVPGSVRTRRISDFGGASQSQLPPFRPAETPTRPSNIHTVAPSVAHARSNIVADSVKKPNTLPGFYDAFAPSVTSTARPSKAPASAVSSPSPNIVKSTGKNTRRSPVKSSQRQRSPPSSPTKRRATTTNSSLNAPPPDVDLAMEDGTGFDINMDLDEGNVSYDDTDMMDGSSEYDEFEPFDRREDLNQTIVTHSPPSSSLSSLQLVLRVVPSPSDTIPDTLAASYPSACARILEVLAGSSRYSNYNVAIRVVAEALVQLAWVLTLARLYEPLAAVWGLCAMLVFSDPLFAASLVRAHSSRKDSDRNVPTKSILDICIHFTLNQLMHRGEDGKFVAELDAIGVAEQCVECLEALCWRLPDELEVELAIIPRTPDVLNAILHPTLPSSLVSRSVRFLTFLATRANVFRHILSFPSLESGPPSVDVDYNRIPHIERLCGYLVDPRRTGPEVEQLRCNILTLFSALTATHIDARAVLTQSYSVVPSIVLFAGNIAKPLYEDDEGDPVRAAYIVRLLNRTFFLLHALVFNHEGDPSFSLPGKLESARNRAFNGLLHIFMATAARICCAQPPDWAPQKVQDELIGMTDVVGELLELVANEPELDAIWSAYQDDGDNGSVDEEEKQARMMDDTANEVPAP